MLLGTSRDVAYGPTAVMSLLTAEFGHHPHNHDDARLAIVLAFINGIVQIVMGVINIGLYQPACSTCARSTAVLVKSLLAEHMTN